MMTSLNVLINTRRTCSTIAFPNSANHKIHLMPCHLFFKKLPDYFLNRHVNSYLVSKLGFRAWAPGFLWIKTQHLVWPLPAVIGNAARWPTSDLRTLLDNYGTSENAAIVEFPILPCAFCKLLLDRSLSAFSPLLLTGSANKEKNKPKADYKTRISRCWKR